MTMHEFQHQNCELTLQEGLDTYYQCFPEDTKVIQDVDGPKWLFGHDCTHVIFGLDISMEQEAILDTWSLWGTDLSIKNLIDFTIASRKNSDFNKLYKKIRRESSMVSVDSCYGYRIILSPSSCLSTKSFNSIYSANFFIYCDESLVFQKF